VSSNRKQFALIGLAAGLFAAVMVAGVAGNVARGNYMAVPVIFSALILAFLFIWLGVWLNQRRIQIMFRRPTPDRLIEHYHATLLQARARKIPNADAVAAHLSALAAVIYGQYDRAREELAAVDWDKAPAMYQGHRLHILALIALLEKRDTVAAIRLASEAEALEATDRAGGLPILHSAVLVAAGGGDPDAVKRLQRAAGRGTGAIPGLCAWALALYFERAGQPAEAARYRERVKEAIPNFVGLAAS
jgi:hypothetical protein